MTPLSQLNYFHTKSGRLIISPNHSNITQSQLHFFKKWAKKDGWRNKRTYQFESKKRAFTLIKGDYSLLCLNRVITKQAPSNPQGHRRNDNSIIVECEIACFKNGVNLGQYGIDWNDFINGDVELLLHLRNLKYKI